MTNIINLLGICLIPYYTSYLFNSSFSHGTSWPFLPHVVLYQMHIIPTHYSLVEISLRTPFLSFRPRVIPQWHSMLRWQWTKHSLTRCVWACFPQFPCCIWTASSAHSVSAGWRVYLDQWYFIRWRVYVSVGWRVYLDQWYFIGSRVYVSVGWRVYLDQWYFIGSRVYVFSCNLAPAP